MEGITIINTIPIYAAANTWMITVAMSCILAAFVIAILGYIFQHYAIFTVLLVACLALLLTCVVFIAIHAFSDNINTDEIEKYQYEVLVDDSVRFNDFNDKYEVVDHRGEIYIIEEKN